MRFSGLKGSLRRSNSQPGTRKWNFAFVVVMVLVFIVLITKVVHVKYVDNNTVVDYMYNNEEQNKLTIIRADGNRLKSLKDTERDDVSTEKQVLKFTNRTSKNNINPISEPVKGIISTASVVHMARTPIAIPDVVKKTNSLNSHPRSPNELVFVYSTNNQDTSRLNTKRKSANLQRGKSNLCSDDFKSRHLMTSSPNGRIGNQLFELCTLIAAANDSCYTAVYKPETFSLDSIFDIQNIVRTNFSGINFGKVHEGVWGRWKSPIHEVITPDKNWTLSGYHQSFKYFQHRKELVRSSLVFKDHIKRDVMNLFKANSLHSKIKVGIHVRRGDFLDTSKLEFGYFPSSLQYINNAMKYYTEKINSKDLAFVFVSDNITWCQENVKIKNVYFSPFKDPGRDLCILTQCDHNIVTTGTFGWMGAWINETGTVLYDKSYPRRQSLLWYGHLKRHYYPDWWIGL